MALRLAEIIGETQTQQSHTHVLLGAPHAKFNISNSRMKEFWDAYISALSDVPTPPLYLAEKPGSELPVLVDIDLKTPGNYPKPLYTEKHIRTIINVYQSALRYSILDKPTEESLVCVLLEKNPTLIDMGGIKYVKHGFHLHFPKLFTAKSVQAAYLLPIVKEKLAGMFNFLLVVSDETSENYEFIDEGSIKVHWLMYGSKKPNCMPYVATRCYNHNAKPISFEEALADYELPLLTGETTKTLCGGQVMRLLPRILSTQLHGRLCYYYTPKPYVATPIVDDFARKKTYRTTYSQKNLDETLKEVQSLLNLISSSRADNRNDWRDVGFCLWNITNGDDDGLSMWTVFSELSPKYNEAEILNMWKNMRPNEYTIGTLKYFAKIDNPKGYEVLCAAKSDTLINNAVEGGHNDLAKLLFNEYHDEFVYSIPNASWYHYNNHKWTQLGKDCADLRCRISDDNGAIIGHFQRHIKQLIEEIEELNGSVTLTATSRRKKKAPMTTTTKTAHK